MPAEPRRDLPVPLRVKLTRPDGRTTVEFAVNISPGGACLHVRDPVEVGQRVQLAFELPFDGTPVSLRARVVWYTCAAERSEHSRFCEMGLRFEEADERVRERLLEFSAHAPDPRR